MTRGEIRHGLTTHVSSIGPFSNIWTGFLFDVLSAGENLFVHIHHLHVTNHPSRAQHRKRIHVLVLAHYLTNTKTDSTPQDQQLHIEPTHAKETNSDELSCEMKAVNIGWVLVSGKSRHTCLKTLPTCQCIYKQWTQVLKLLKHKWYYLHFNEKAVRVF
jgi:hypothetical protein